MRIAVIGSGYAGTTLAAGLAALDHDVTAVDIDPEIVSSINAGEAPIHEPGLDQLLSEHAGQNLTATTEYAAIRDAAIVFIAVQTPSREDGSIDVAPLRGAVQSAARTLAEESHRDDGHVVAIKSTVTPPQVSALRDEILEIAGDAVHLELAMNPEFLREGSAVEDFLNPNKLVFGTDASLARERLEAAFTPLIADASPAVIHTDPETASMIKYANNAFLAAKISLINDLGNICKVFGIDAYEVAEAIGTDDRIGERFLRSGVGFGGSCFPKDVRAIIAASTEAGYEPSLLSAALAVNDGQPDRMLDLLERHTTPAESRVAVLGLAFKPGTDDIRNSRSIPVIEGLLERGATVIAYDPVATKQMRERFPDIEYARSAREALDGAGAALVLTAWDEFAALNGAFEEMSDRIVIDGRRVIEPQDGMTYEGLTW